MTQSDPSKSMWDLLQPAPVRAAIPARMLIQGPANSGKSTTALIVGSVIAKSRGARLIAIDNEQRYGRHTALSTFGDRFEFEHLPWPRDLEYNPKSMTKTLRDAERSLGDDDVIVIDGISPFWSGPGGVLELVDRKFGEWKEVRPLLTEMWGRLLTIPAHVIMTCRAKMHYSVTETESQSGQKKTKVELVGLGPDFDKQVPFDLSLVLQQDHQHQLDVIKSEAPGIEGYWPSGIDEAARLGEVYLEWLSQGAPLVTGDQADKLLAVFDRVAAGEQRMAAKQEFAAKFGSPRQLLASKHEEAIRFALEVVADRIAVEVTSPAPVTQMEGPDAVFNSPEPELVASSNGR